MKPVSPCRINSGGPPLSDTTAGSPDAMASIATTLPKVSVVLGKANT